MSRRRSAVREEGEARFIFCVLNGRAGPLHDAPFLDTFTVAERETRRFEGRFLPLRYRLLVCAPHGPLGPAAESYVSFSLS